MKNITEDLNRVKAEVQSPAAQQAKQLGLQYVGFGRYTDPSTGQVTHIVQNDRLTKFNRAVKTNTFQTNNADDYGNYGAVIAPEIQQLHDYLTTQYSPDKYDDAELNAIYSYTNDAYPDINSRLASLPPDVPANKIERSSVDDTLPDFIAAMDSIMKKSRAPVDFITYTRLSADYRVEDLQSGMKFKFLPYRNTSINLNTVLNSAQPAQTSYAGRPQVLIMQILVKKNTRGLYAADFSAKPDDFEFILPRGSTLEIADGPKNLVGSDAMSANMNLEVVYFDCKVKA
jgi:hypothetical protein